MSHNRVEDEVAIKAMLSEMYQAWVDNDADRFVGHYTDDARCPSKAARRSTSS